MEGQAMQNNLDPITGIRCDIANRTHGDDIGMFTVKTANETVHDAALRPIPRSLFMTLWYEGEVTCLFADSNVGKSIFAVQIADQIATTEPVLYVDCELSEKQFQLRYTDAESGRMHQFPESLFHAVINPQKFDAGYHEEKILSDIANAAEQLHCRIIIIDNLSYLCNAAEKGSDAGSFMVKLMNLKKEKDWSILVIAHTPKRDPSRPINQNDLAGSKRLYNFFDSAFAIGISGRDNRLRYVKQLKARSCEIQYGGDNVLLYEIIKTDGFLRFSFVGNARESEHLRAFSPEDKEERKQQVAELKDAGKTIREVAVELGLSKSTVGRLFKELETVPTCPTVPRVPAGTTGQ